MLVADDPLARAALATALANSDAGEVVGQENSEADLVAALELHRPDVLLWDLGWDAGQTGAAIERLSELSEALPPVVALLPEADEETRLAADVWAAGARGLLRRQAAPERDHRRPHRGAGAAGGSRSRSGAGPLPAPRH